MKVTTITLDFQSGPAQVFNNVDAELVGSFLVITEASGQRRAFSTNNLRTGVWMPALLPVVAVPAQPSKGPE